MSVTQATLLGDTFGSKASGTIPVGGIIMWSGSTASIPTGWALCNGANGTPNLRDRFIVGAGSDYEVGATGGVNSVALTINEMPSHSHGGKTGDDSPDHTHNYTGVEITQETSGGSSTRPRRDEAKTTTGASNRHQHGITAEGGNGAHENRPPYYALAFIMRVS
jgi:microcystin-dependent protein